MASTGWTFMHLYIIPLWRLFLAAALNSGGGQTNCCERNLTSELWVFTHSDADLLTFFSNLGASFIIINYSSPEGVACWKSHYKLISLVCLALKVLCNLKTAQFSLEMFSHFSRDMRTCLKVRIASWSHDLRAVKFNSTTRPPDMQSLALLFNWLSKVFQTCLISHINWVAV